MKVDIEDSAAQTKTVIQANSAYGSHVYTIEISRSDWAEGTLRLEIKAGNGMAVELCMLDEVITPLLDALYRAKFHQKAVTVAASSEAS